MSADRKVTSWRDIIKIHPAAAAFPMMPEAELRTLGEDIRDNGMHNEVVLWGSAPQALLDGRNRLDAMELVGLQTHDGVVLTVTTRIETSKEDPVALVVSLNLKRRHLDESQRAMVAAKLANMRQGERTDLPSIEGKLSQADAAKLLNVSAASVERAAVVRREGAPELVEAVERGEIAVSSAAAIAKTTPDEQKRIVELPATERRGAARQPRATPPKKSSTRRPEITLSAAMTSAAALKSDPPTKAAPGRAAIEISVLEVFGIIRHWPSERRGSLWTLCGQHWCEQMFRRSPEWFQRGVSLPAQTVEPAKPTLAPIPESRQAKPVDPNLDKAMQILRAAGNGGLTANELYAKANIYGKTLEEGVAAGILRTDGHRYTVATPEDLGPAEMPA
jgi:hypothetical protein